MNYDIHMMNQHEQALIEKQTVLGHAIKVDNAVAKEMHLQLNEIRRTAEERCRGIEERLRHIQLRMHDNRKKLTRLMNDRI